MASLYPTNLDEFRAHLAGFDYMQSQDVFDMGSAARNIQVELGVNPSGSHGTLSARLFHNGNLNENPAGWNRLKYDGAQAIPNSVVFNEDAEVGGFVITYSEAKMAGQDSVFGEDVATPFGAMQGPLTSAFGSNFRGRVPWRSLIADLDKGFGEWVARDGQNATMTAAGTPASTWGYIIWNLLT